MVDGVGTSDYPNSYNKTKEYWIDINGDGLQDKIKDNNYNSILEQDM
jgi:hypothetical protein